MDLNFWISSVALSAIKLISLGENEQTDIATGAYFKLIPAIAEQTVPE